MTQNVEDEAKQLVEELTDLVEEMEIVLLYTKSLWSEYPKHFPYTSYGFAMCLFSEIDLFSKYWCPNLGNQTMRMFVFLNTCLGYPKEESGIGVQSWRHKLMHTSQPRLLTEQTSGKQYKWFLQYKLEPSQHWRFQREENSLTLNLRVIEFSN